MITRRVNTLGGRRRVWRNPVGRKTKQKVQEERPMMDDPKKAQELLGQITGKAVETMTVWADANQRVLRELVEFGATSAKEGVRLYAELQQSAIEALRDSQAAALRFSSRSPSDLRRSRSAATSSRSRSASTSAVPSRLGSERVPRPAPAIMLPHPARLIHS